MDYWIEKEVFDGYAFHYANRISKWEKLDSCRTASQAIEKCQILAEKEKGVFRVRNFKNGTVLCKMQIN